MHDLEFVEIENYDEIKDFDKSLSDKEIHIADILQVIISIYIYDYKWIYI
jgi:hypothetical protein